MPWNPSRNHHRDVGDVPKTATMNPRKMRQVKLSRNQRIPIRNNAWNVIGVCPPNWCWHHCGPWIGNPTNTQASSCGYVWTAAWNRIIWDMTNHQHRISHRWMPLMHVRIFKIGHAPDLYYRHDWNFEVHRFNGDPNLLIKMQVK